MHRAEVLRTRLQRQRQHVLPLALLLLPAALAALNIWLGPGILNTHAGGDSPFLLIRVYELVANLQAGIFPARWMPNAAFGLGYPFFNFYAALPYYCAALLNLIGFNLLTAIKLTQTLGMFAAAASMYWLARQLLSQHGALLASAAYTLAPFHLANIYVRGDSLSEFWAFVWYPLILCAVWRLRYRASGTGVGVLILALAVAALLLTHNVSALLFAPMIVLWALAVFVWPSSSSLGGRSRRVVLIALVLAALLALGLSAWFWLPALGESHSVQLNNQTTGFFNYANHFRTSNLVQWSLWFDYAVTEHLSVFSMGLVQAALTLAGAAAWFFWRKQSRRTFYLISASFVLSTFLMLPLSTWVWANAPLLALAQFPWRYLSVQAVFAALLIGGLTEASKQQTAGRSRAILLSSFCILHSALPFLPNQRLNIRAEDVTPHSIQLYEWYTGNIGTTIRAEYLPKAVQPWPRMGFGLMGQRPRALAAASDGASVSATAESELLSATPHQQVWRIRIDQDFASVVLPMLAADGWELAPPYNAASTNQVAPPRLGRHDESGRLLVELYGGEHRVTLNYIGTPLQRFSERISLVALLALVVVAYFALRPINTKLLLRGGGWALLVLLVLLGLMGLAQVARLLQPASEPALQAIDPNERLFPHRGPLALQNAAGQSYELVGAEISPTNLRAGQPFTLALQWRGAVPQGITITQESPNTSAYASHQPLFVFNRESQAGHAQLDRYVALRAALPGPTLLKLSLGHNEVTLVGPTITNTAPNTSGSNQALHTFANGSASGIRLHRLDLLQTAEHELCLRPIWSRAPNAGIGAAALQIAVRVYGADERTIAVADWQPQGGYAPTWAWPADVEILDGKCGLRFVHKPTADEALRVRVILYVAATLREVDAVDLRGVFKPERKDFALVDFKK